MTRRRRYLFALADKYQLTPEERHDLAEILLRRDVHTWRDLSHAEQGRLVDALEGHALVEHLLQTRSHANG